MKLNANDVLGKINAPDAMFEMTNLQTKHTGVKKLVIFISTEMGQHGPRVKVYRKLGKGNPTTSVGVIQPMDVFDDGLKVKASELKQVREFIDLNRDKLLDFWNNGLYWPLDKQSALYGSFTKVPDKKPTQD